MNWGYALRRPKLVCYLLGCFFLMANTSMVFAQGDSSTAKLIEYLTQEKAQLTLSNNQATQSTEPLLDRASLKAHNYKNQVKLLLIQAKLSSLDSFLVNQRKQQQNLLSHLKSLQQLPLDRPHDIAAQEEINKMTALNDENNSAIELIQANIRLAQSLQTALVTEKETLALSEAKLDEHQQLDDLTKRIKLLEDARRHLYHKNIGIQQEKVSEANFNRHITNEAKLLLNNQAITLIQYRITGLEVQKRLIRADYLLLRDQSSKAVQSVSDTYKNAISQLAAIESSIRTMLDLLKNEIQLVSEPLLKQNLVNIQKTASLRLTDITQQLQTLKHDFEKKQQQLKQLLSLRQGLTAYHMNSWSSVFHQIVQIPEKLYAYMSSLTLKLMDHYLWKDIGSAVFFWFGVGFIILISIVLRRMLRTVTLDNDRSRWSEHLFDSVLILFYRNIPGLALLGIMLVIFFLNHIPFTNYHVIMTLLLVWIIFYSAVLIARLFLLENLDDETGEDARLYYRLKWLFILGGTTTALMELSHQLQLSLLLQDLFNRLFMLFLLSLSLVGWKNKNLIPFLMRPILKTKKRYFRNVISLFAVLIPLILLTTAVIGLVGYINLAWTMSSYQAYLLIILAAYVLLRGLFFDALELLSEWMISSLRNGWLWIEVILKPLDKIIRVALFLSSLYMVVYLFGWTSDPVVVGALKSLVTYPFLNMSGVRITINSSLEFIVLLCLLIWAAKWTREFSYRGLYKSTEDAGIRNSLSVFTQYAVILIGSFLALRVLGLDFSGMSIVLGGLAVGMGFGLRDFASNIIGGIMLLIERPVREGDLITIGEYEGRVAHIGIRSMRVSSWDNMEVLIPNAETFSKPFTNWTHQDNIVRTVVPIKVSRADDPVVVQQLIIDVLEIIPEVLPNPPVQVFLKQIDDALIDFEVRYFVNIQTHTRFEIRSKVLFAIMAQFKAAGVQAPIPPYHVELSNDTAK
jgi:potassium efflux system protein